MEWPTFQRIKGFLNKTAFQLPLPGADTALDFSEAGKPSGLGSVVTSSGATSHNLAESPCSVVHAEVLD